MMLPVFLVLVTVAGFALGERLGDLHCRVSR